MSSMIQRRSRKKPSRKNGGWVPDSLVLGDELEGERALWRLRKANAHFDFRIVDWRTWKAEDEAV